MKRVDLEDMDDRMGPAAVQHPLTDALGLADVAINYYELATGDSFAFGYHAHEQQEEIFYIQEGTVTFRTTDGDVEVGAGELVRFGPGEFQRGVNEGDTRVRALAIGAPQDAGATEVLRHCEACESETGQEIELAEDKSAVITRCGDCGSVTGRFT